MELDINFYYARTKRSTEQGANGFLLGYRVSESKLRADSLLLHAL